MLGENPTYERFDTEEAESNPAGPNSQAAHGENVKDPNKNPENLDSFRKENTKPPIAVLSPDVTGQMNAQRDNDIKSAKILMASSQNPDSLWPPSGLETQVGGTEGGSTNEVHRA